MILIDHDQCDLCGACVGVCPADCISMYETTMDIDNEACIQCGFCIQVCPMEALKEESDD